MSELRKSSFTDSNEIVPESISNDTYMMCKLDTYLNTLFLGYAVEKDDNMRNR